MSTGESEEGSLGRDSRETDPRRGQWDGMGCRGKSLKSNFIIYEVLAWAKLYGNMFLYRFECFLKETVQVVLYGIHDINFMNYTSI